MKQKIGMYQIIIITFFLTRGLLLLSTTPYLINISKNDALFSIIVGSILGLIPVSIYIKINKKQPNDNLFDIIKKRFPPFFSYLLFLLLIIGIVIFGGFFLSQITLFIYNIYLDKTSLFIISLTFLLLCYFLAKQGLSTIARSCEIFFMIFIILFFFQLCGLIPLFDQAKVKPFLTGNWYNCIKGSTFYALMSTLPLFFLTMIPNNQRQNNIKSSKIIFIGYLLSCCTVFLEFLLMFGTIGINLASYYNYPQMAILKKISYFHFIERLEGVLAINYLLDAVSVLALLLFTCQKSITTICFKKSHKFLYGLCLFIIFILGSHLSLELNNLLFPLLIVFIGIPLLILIQLYVTKDKKNN